MGRLHRVILITPDVERLRAFHEQALGFAPVAAGGGAVLATRGVPVAMEPGAQPAIALAFEVGSLDERVTRLGERGVTVLEAPREEPWGRVAVVRDPDGNAVRLVQLKQSAAQAAWPAKPIRGAQSPTTAAAAGSWGKPWHWPRHRSSCAMPALRKYRVSSSAWPPGSRGLTAWCCGRA